MKVTNKSNVQFAFLRKLTEWAKGKCFLDEYARKSFGSWPPVTITFRNTAKETHLSNLTIKSSTGHTFDYDKPRDGGPKAERRINFTTTQKFYVTVFIGPADKDNPVARWYNVILQLGKLFARFNAVPVPDGDLGIYRQKVGMEFLNNHAKLVAEWNAAVPKRDPDAPLRAAIRQAEENVKKFTRRENIAANTRAKWERKLKRLNSKYIGE